MRIELLWFDGCPNHEHARRLLREVLAVRALDVSILEVDVPDEATGKRVRFPGSPTIRVDGRDVEPGAGDCEDCTPRCRVYPTREGLRGVPEREWIETAIDAAAAAS